MCVHFALFSIQLLGEREENKGAAARKPANATAPPLARCAIDASVARGSLKCALRGLVFMKQYLSAKNCYT